MKKMLSFHIEFCALGPTVNSAPITGASSPYQFIKPLDGNEMT